MSKLFEGYNEDVIPFGPAAGAINGNSKEEITEKVIDVARSPAAAVTWGSITRNGGVGNAIEHGGRVYYHNSRTGETVNSMGLPNPGYKEALKLFKVLKSHADEYGKPLIPSISPGKGEDSIIVLPEMAYGFAEAGAEFIEINYSCPNKVINEGGREPILGFDPQTMFEIDGYLTEQTEGVTIIRKLPPYLDDKEELLPLIADRFDTIAKRYKQYGIAVLNLSNTKGGHQMLTETGELALDVPRNEGGLSGLVMSGPAREQLQQFKSHTSEQVGYISCLGVMDGAEVYHRVHQLGADLVQGVTVFMQNEQHGISYGETVNRIAHQYAEAMALAKEAA